MNNSLPSTGNPLLENAGIHAETPLARLKERLGRQELEGPMSGSDALETTSALTPHDFEREVAAIFSELTRYPIEMLDVNANLEDDLGIDSVKLAEIISVLRVRYGLPAAEEMPLSWESLFSIAGIAKALRPFVANQVQDKSGTSSPPEQENYRMASVPDGIFMQEFMESISELLNIPLQLLRPDDLLETDLSFGEQILSRTLKSLDAKYSLGQGLVKQASFSSFRTLRDIANAIVDLKGNASPAPDLKRVLQENAILKKLLVERILEIEIMKEAAMAESIHRDFNRPGS